LAASVARPAAKKKKAARKAKEMSTAKGKGKTVDIGSVGDVNNINRIVFIIVDDVVTYPSL
jgi:hypothetical protein